MNKKTWKITYSLPFLLLALSAGPISISSCEDEVVDRLVDIPGDTVTVDVSGLNHIIAFHVEEFSTDTVLEAAIKDDSLIVYWPSFKPLPSTISPDIIVPEGASVTPASGESVPFVDGTAFTVTGEDQSERKYVLKVVVYQPVPYYNAGHPVGFEIEGILAVVNDLAYMVVFENNVDVRLDGDFFIPDTTRTRIYVTNLKTEQETRLKINSITSTDIKFTIPPDLEKGYYSTTLVSGVHAIKDDSVFIKHPQPSFRWPFSKVTAAQGAEFEISVTHARDITKVQLYTAASGDAEKVALPPFEIVSVTEGQAGSVTLRVPDDFPIGDYSPNVTELHVTTAWANSGEGVVKFCSTCVCDICGEAFGWIGFEATAP